REKKTAEALNSADSLAWQNRNRSEKCFHHKGHEVFGELNIRPSSPSCENIYHTVAVLSCQVAALFSAAAFFSLPSISVFL
ncbi:MAG: hypothetical protein ACXW6R_22170, partial [Candidatus Binatia bacterium]